MAAVDAKGKASPRRGTYKKQGCVGLQSEVAAVSPVEPRPAANGAAATLRQASPGAGHLQKTGLCRGFNPRWLLLPCSEPRPRRMAAGSTLKAKASPRGGAPTKNRVASGFIPRWLLPPLQPAPRGEWLRGDAKGKLRPGRAPQNGVVSGLQSRGGCCLSCRSRAPRRMAVGRR